MGSVSIANIPVEMIQPCGYSIRMANTVRETAASVYTAFRRLPPKDRLAVIEKLLQDRSVREDLLDVATIEQRRDVYR